MAEEFLIDEDELNYGESKFMTATRPLKVREQPSLDGKEIRILAKNEEVEILEVLDGWAKIPDGYCMIEYLK